MIAGDNNHSDIGYYYGTLELLSRDIESDNKMFLAVMIRDYG